MLEQRIYEFDDREGLRALIEEYGWATLVSGASGGPVVSHLPVILDPGADDLTVLGHLPRTDADLHGLGDNQVLIIIAGPNGYLSPALYQAGPYVPTWNYVVAHLHGRPEPLGAEDTFAVLERTVEHFEARRERPWRLATVAEFARSIAPHATGFRLRPTRVAGKRKLSQDKPAEVVERVIRGLDDPPLVRAMRRVHPR